MQIKMMPSRYGYLLGVMKCNEERSQLTAELVFLKRPLYTLDLVESRFDPSTPVDAAGSSRVTASSRTARYRRPATAGFEQRIKSRNGEIPAKFRFDKFLPENRKLVETESSSGQQSSGVDEDDYMVGVEGLRGAEAGGRLPAGRRHALQRLRHLGNCFVAVEKPPDPETLAQPPMRVHQAALAAAAAAEEIAAASGATSKPSDAGETTATDFFDGGVAEMRRARDLSRRRNGRSRAISQHDDKLKLKQEMRRARDELERRMSRRRERRATAGVSGGAISSGAAYSGEMEEGEVEDGEVEDGELQDSDSENDAADEAQLLRLQRDDANAAHQMARLRAYDSTYVDPMPLAARSLRRHRRVYDAHWAVQRHRVCRGTASRPPPPGELEDAPSPTLPAPELLRVVFAGSGLGGVGEPRPHAFEAFTLRRMLYHSNWDTLYNTISLLLHPLNYGKLVPVNNGAIEQFLKGLSEY